jgi:putative acetyltransferase
MNLSIRPTPPDHPRALALIEQLDAYLYSVYPPEEVYALDVESLKHPSVTFLGVWDGDDAVGCGAVRVMDGDAGTGGARYGEIKRMFVAPARRGQGIAQRVLAALEDHLRGQGIDRALLETGDPQVEAVRLYERTGYVRRGPFGDYPDNGSSVFMEKRWTAA